MSQFIQLHLLTSYPPSNLNRDDLGRPKTAIIGGTERLRISSQSLKRAWRTSEIFECALSEWKGTRTKRLGKQILEEFFKDTPQEQSKQWAERAAKIAEQFGKLKKNSVEIEQLAHISPQEFQLVKNLAATLVKEDRHPTDDDLKLLRETPKAVDIALFGRMLASSSVHNVEAAAQVAHAFTVNGVKIEDDFFTAVDDLKNVHAEDEDAGAGHMGDLGFGAGVFYIYICINKTLLLDNLSQDKELANKTLSALLDAAAKVSPTGKQNSFASRAYTSYILAEKGPQQPRSLAVAFLKPVWGDDHMEKAIQTLEQQRKNFDDTYGECAEAVLRMKAHGEKAEGTLEAIKKFMVAD